MSPMIRTRRGRRVWLRPAWCPPPWLLALAGVVLIGTTLVVDWQDGRVPDGWRTTTAVAVEEIPPSLPCRGPSCTTRHWIEVTIDGTIRRHIYAGPAELHERLPFAYDPDGTRWKVMNQGRNVPWTMGLPGVVLLVVALVVALVSVPRPRSTLRC